MIEYLRNIFRIAAIVLDGMKITLVTLLRKPITMQYPEQRWNRAEGMRDLLYNDIDNCIGCDKCAMVCPVDCIMIDKVKLAAGETLPKAVNKLGIYQPGSKDRQFNVGFHLPTFDIHMGQCCDCNLCVEVCPTECLIMIPNDPNGYTQRTDLVYRFTKIPLEKQAELRARGVLNSAQDKLRRADKERQAAAAARVKAALPSPGVAHAAG